MNAAHAWCAATFIVAFSCRMCSETSEGQASAVQHDRTYDPRAAGISSTYLKLFPQAAPPMDIAAIVPDVAGEV
ncbi:hypothetical protein [Bradyrhizobium erythrophlei]|uniref:hypothetical protein n=1 Tax=Bradyrhizobium erythrophlei TaxID=1437360 RepID=UPI0015C57F49|nr:hypothetical protein [Bradyrhizobium erythrophlei]